MLILIGNRSVWIRQEEKAESAWLHLISHINLIIGWENVDLLSVSPKVGPKRTHFRSWLQNLIKMFIPALFVVD